MATKLHHKKCVQKPFVNSKQNRTQMLSRITGLIILVTTVGFLSFTSGCQENQSVDSKNKQASSQASQKEKTPAKTVSTDKDNTPTSTENKPPNTTSITDTPPAVPAIDEAFMITPGKPMTKKRFLAVRNKLKQIGLAFHNFHEVNRFFLPDPEKHPEYYDENGRLKVSWRVHMLPFLDQAELFQRFQLDEPWDSPTNAPLAKNMPDIFRSPDTPANSNLTRFRVFEGEWITNSKGEKNPTSIFPLGKPVQIRDIKDGTSRTGMVVEVGADQAIKWTKPDELDAKSPLKTLGATAEGVPTLLADGHAGCFKKNAGKYSKRYPGKTFWENLIQPQDNNSTNFDKFDSIHTARRLKQLSQFEKLKKIATAFHNYHETFTTFPPAKENLTNGKPLLSWRYHLLPFLGEFELYNGFNPKEPWDSPHNKALIEQMPDIFRFDPETKPGETQIVTFSGENTPFPDGPAIRIRDTTDGTSNTILFVKAAPDKAVPWTKPVDLPFNPADPLKAIGKLSAPEFIAAMMDGSIRYVPTTIPKKTLNNLIQHNDSNVIDVDLKLVNPHYVTPKTDAPTARVITEPSSSVPAIDKALIITSRKIMSNLKRISEGFSNYVKQNDYFLPPAKKHLINGKQMLSWRVHLLPYLGEEELYKQFNLKEPWDSPHNKKLLNQMPDFYQFFGGSQPGYTTIMMFTGKGTSFPNGLGLSLDLIASKDGISNTILCVIAAPDKAVPWTKPVDLPFNPADPIKAMGNLSGKKFIAILMDGRIQTIPTNISAKKLKDWIQYDNGLIPN